MTDQVAERLERIFTELMVGETMAVRERTRLVCLTWDSLMQLNLISAIEQEFQVTFTDDEAADLNSFAAVLAVLQEKLLAQESEERAA